MGSYTWVISRVAIIITPIRRLITPVITAHEPPSTGVQLQRNFQRTLRAGGWAHSAGGMEIRDKVDSSPRVWGFGPLEDSCCSKILRSPMPQL